MAAVFGVQYTCAPGMCVAGSGAGAATRELPCDSRGVDSSLILLCSGFYIKNSVAFVKGHGIKTCDHVLSRLENLMITYNNVPLYECAENMTKPTNVFLSVFLFV